MKILQLIDHWLVSDVIEPAAHSFQRWTGRNNYWLVKRILFFLGFALVGIVPIGMIQLCREGKWGSAVLIPIVVLLSGFPMLIVWCLFDVEEKESGERLRAGHANPQKISVPWMFLRYGCAVFSMLAIAFVWLTPNRPEVSPAAARALCDIVTFSGALVVIQTYLLACDPLPPRKSKLRVWKEVITTFFKFRASTAPH